ncbi:MAG TPA: murein biosynthesis integral membrane protein MurJ [Hyphomicrobiales bacterium]|nr:murein biosynthesis integral membrane protein MurJ [Hyphomicrobiales bacterium]
MWRQFASVSGLTLLSRLVGFARDVAIAAFLGAGPLADAFMVAFRLPNHFRAIFAEGAFNAAFVPAYTRSLTEGGERGARDFAGELLVLTVAVQLVILALALALTPWVVRLLAPGFVDQPVEFARTVALTRITFPYLGLISVVTLVSGMLNAHARFAAAAAAPVLLNLCMIGALFLAPHFPTTAHALAWGVTASGVAQLVLVLAALWRGGIGFELNWPRLDLGVRRFLRAFGPAVIGSGGQQIAMFADTIIATFLPRGSVSYLYYADRLYQLPLALVGIALGTVLLPELSRRLAEGDAIGARRRLNRAIEGALVLTLPCAATFLVLAEPLVAVLFGRGAFDAAAIAGSSSVLRAYGLGLVAVVLVRALVPAFYARGDTATPVKVLLAATAVNVGLKTVLIGPFAAAGLSLATSIGAWVNALLLAAILLRRGDLVRDPRLVGRGLAALVAAVAMAAVLVASGPLAAPLAGAVRQVPDLVPLAVRGLLGLAAYGAVVVAASRLPVRGASAAG